MNQTSEHIKAKGEEFVASNEWSLQNSLCLYLRVIAIGTQNSAKVPHMKSAVNKWER